MIPFLLVIQIIICAALVAVILLQRSEGGALGMGGGGTGGLMTARGAGNLLTRTTAILATAFFVVSFGLTILGNVERRSSAIDQAADVRTDPNAIPRPAAPVTTPPADLPVTPGAAPAPKSLDELTGAAPAATAPATEPAPGAAK